MMKTKKAIGKRKDKLNWEIIEEFVGLRAKMYSLKAKKEKRGKEGEHSQKRYEPSRLLRLFI